MALRSPFRRPHSLPLSLSRHPKLVTTPPSGKEVPFHAQPMRVLTPFRALKPGGYIELVEMHVVPTSPDHTLPVNSQIMALYTLLDDVGQDIGLDLSVAPKYKPMMLSAGFEDVVEEVFDLPIGDWMTDRRMKEVGAFQRFQMTEGLHGIAFGALTRVAGWSPTEVEVFLAGVRREMKDRSVHSMYKL